MKKIKSTSLLILLVICLFGQEPTFEWAKQFGGPIIDEGQSIALDGSGNVYITGKFEETTDFDPGSGIFNLTSVGGLDIFITKLDAEGNLVWAKAFGSIKNENSHSISVDPFGNVYTSGTFMDSTDFDPGSSTYYLDAQGASDAFILKLDADGNFIWAKSIGGEGSERGYSASDAEGNVYITGRFSDTVDFDPGSGVYNIISIDLSSDIYILKLNSLGEFVWAKAIGDSLYDEAYSIAVDEWGNIYTTGRFYGTVDFDPGSGIYNLTSAPSADIFVSKLDTDGNFAWAKAIIGSSGNRGISIEIDNSNDVLFIGEFRETADFDPGPNTYNLTSIGDEDIFVSKLNSEGNFLWAKSFGGIAQDESRDVAIDKFNNIYITGFFNETVDFDPGASVFNLTQSGVLYDVFISKLDTDGNFLWAGKLGGYGSSIGNSIVVDESGNLYTTGDFSNTVDFDPSPFIFHLDAVSSVDAFVHKMSQCFLEAIIHSSDGLEICQGETLSLTVNEGMSYVWNTGDTTSSIFVTPQSTMSYSVTVSEGTNCSEVDSVTITVNETPDVFITGYFEICEFDSTTLGVNEGGNYLWSTGETSELISISPNETTLYNVTLTDGNGCSNSDSIMVVVNTLPNAGISGDFELCPGDTVILTASGGVDYFWSTGNSSSSIEIIPVSSSLFAVTVTDENNCSNSASVNIEVDEEYCPPCVTVAVPNVFTPDGDQRNDYFYVFADGETKIKDFRIYSRWGKIVHHSSEPWDGTLKGEPLPSDVYIYMITIETNCETKQLRGDITLIR